MLHHITLWVPDLRRAAPSWGWLLGELGFQKDHSLDRPPTSGRETSGGGGVLLFRRHGFAVVLEQSSDMVPGMLYSRLRPGLNHLAFSLPDGADLATIVAHAGDHGWSILPSDRHPIAGGAEVAYLEDRDGFEVEVVAQGQDAQGQDAQG